MEMGTAAVPSGGAAEDGEGEEEVAEEVDEVEDAEVEASELPEELAARIRRNTLS